jgi:hypothetical protein
MEVQGKSILVRRRGLYFGPKTIFFPSRDISFSRPLFFPILQLYYPFTSFLLIFFPLSSFSFLFLCLSFTLSPFFNIGLYSPSPRVGRCFPIYRPRDGLCKAKLHLPDFIMYFDITIPNNDEILGTVTILIYIPYFISVFGVEPKKGK